MAILEELQPFRKTNYISRINRAYRPVARELRAAQASPSAVTVDSSPDASLLGELFTFRFRYEANQALTACGNGYGFPYVLTLPFRNGVTLPYLLDIQLQSAAPLRASLGMWLTNRGRWFTDPLDGNAARRLKGLRLPGVGWVHASGGLKHTIHCGGLILPPDQNTKVNRWIVYSAYQGFLVGVRPRAVRYLKAASRLQSLLNAW